MEPKNKSLKESFRHAFEGLQCGLKSERNMKVHVAATVLVVASSVILGLTLWEKAVVYLLCGAVITAELFNTAIENVVDICCPEFDMRAKRAKDTAAAAVLVISITAAAVGIIVFFPYAAELAAGIQRII